MAEEAPPLTLTLDWEGELRFQGRSQDTTIVLDSSGTAGPSPVQALAFGLAGCMAMDVVHILAKARQPPDALRAELTARRAVEAPRRLTAVRLRFIVRGDLHPEQVERAIRLSRDKYCSVWHSMRQDIEFETSVAVEGPAIRTAG